jgi:site-specific DNA recombinase
MRTAAYVRYSSDAQREASLEDQLRNCRAYCTRHGWPEPVVYSDAAISGARMDRPGYRSLLADATRFDVILVDDLSRLSRDSIETQKAVKRLTFAGVRLVGVSDGVDTGRKSHKADVGLRGLVSEMYLDDLAEKTHRGLTGRALSGASAGGLPYGYRVTAVGKRAIDDEQAAVVRRIYAEYLAGGSARSIAAGLNRDGIRPARGTTWAMSAIFGDVRRGIGILANPIYVGRQVWNRSRWVKHPESGRRVRQERPESEWVITEHPELAIVDAATWEAAQRRIRHSSRATGTAGRPPRHLFSGILRCGGCSGPMVIVDRYRYGCARAKDRGTCSANLFAPRKLVDEKLLAGVQEQLLSESSFRDLQQHVTSMLKRAAPDLDGAVRKISDAERVHGNVMAAIRAGIITPSTKAELESAERAIATAREEFESLKAFQPSQIVPRLRERWRKAVAELSDRGRRSDQARMALRELLGERVMLRNENGDLVAEIAASSDAQITMVAGAGFEPATFGL